MTELQMGLIGLGVAAVFGVFHAVNLIGGAPGAVGIQAVCAACTGFALCGTVAYYRSIVPALGPPSSRRANIGANRLAEQVETLASLGKAGRHEAAHRLFGEAQGEHQRVLAEIETLLADFA